MNTLATCVCLLLMFYTVESLERERRPRLAAISMPTPVAHRLAAPRQGARQQAAVGLAIVLATGLGWTDRDPDPGQGRLRPGPFLLVWGLLLLPTLLVWTCVRAWPSDG